MSRADETASDVHTAVQAGGARQRAQGSQREVRAVSLRTLSGKMHLGGTWKPDLNCNQAL